VTSPAVLHPGMIVPPEFRLPTLVVAARPLTMPCPTCGGDAAWQWVWAAAGGGTAYPAIDCPGCDHR
jgi:hypothetical protein